MRFLVRKTFSPFNTAGLACLALLFANSFLQAQTPVTNDSPHVQFRMSEFVFQAKSQLDEPLDESLNMVLTAKDGDSIKVPGFWNGDDEYVVRFTPPDEGQWSWQTESTIKTLDQLSGKFEVEPAHAEARGGVMVDPSHSKRFIYQNGEQYFPIAFECDWLFALDAENEAGIPRTESFVGSIANCGFNQIVMNAFAFDVNWKKDPLLQPHHDFGSPEVFPFLGTNDAPQHDVLNIEYFRRLDRVIECLDRKQVVAHLMIYVWNKRVNWPDANSDADNRYFDYVVKRYQAYPNIVWDISKEALGYGHNDVNYITDRIKRLRKLDGHKRLVTVHDYSYCRRFPDELDFISVQLWTSELYGVMRRTTELFKGKPILNIEHGGYERGPYRVFVGAYTSPETCLERAYQCVFAGTFPTHYWQGAAWNVIVTDFDSLPEESKPRFEYYGFLSKLEEHYSLGQLEAGHKHSNSGFCLTNRKDLFVYYVPKENEYFNLQIPRQLRGRSMTGTWFNPFDGTFGEPIKKEVVQWPAFDVPKQGGFKILIVEIGDEAKSAKKQK